MVKLSDKEIVEGIQKGRNKSLLYLYEEYYPMINDLIIRNSGSESDAKDIFQEAVIIIYQKIKSNGFRLTSSFKTYLYSICWKLWLQRLSSIKKSNIVEYDEKLILMEIISEDFTLYEEEKIYQEHFQQLRDECKRLLRLFFSRMSYKDISESMNLSISYVKKLKFICKEKLYNSISKDPRYIELTKHKEIKKHNPKKSKKYKTKL